VVLLGRRPTLRHVRWGRHLILLFFQAEDGIRDPLVTGVQTCALPISPRGGRPGIRSRRGQSLAAPPRGGGSRRPCESGSACRSSTSSGRACGRCRGCASSSRSEERRVGKEGRGWGSGDVVE